MAFGFDLKKELGSNSDDSPTEKPTFGGNGYYDGFSAAAAEEGGTRPQPRKMSRIDQPRTRSIIAGSVAGRGVEDDASDPSTSVEKQMELESANEIQYRTCSWQKVCPLLPSMSCFFALSNWRSCGRLLSPCLAARPPSHFLSCR